MSGSGSGRGQRSKQKSYAGMDPYMKSALADPLTAYLSRMVGKGATPYTGQMVAELTPGQRAAMGDIRGAFGRVMATAPEDIQKRYEAQIRAPAMFEWEEFVQPEIKEAYGGPGGYYSSERMEAERRGAEDLGRYLASTRAQMETEMEERSMAAAMGLGEFETAGLGGLERRIQQEKLLRSFEEFIRTSPEASPWIEMIMQLLGVGRYEASRGYAKAGGGGGGGGLTYFGGGSSD